MIDIIYKTNGEVIETSPKNGTNYTLEELKEIVGNDKVMYAKFKILWKYRQ